MDIAKLMGKVKKLQIKTNRLVNDMFGGEYHSAFKGKGLEFADLRKYEPGDDYRAIDWKVTARFNSPYIKLYEEERELTIFFILDVSPGMEFASKFVSKRQIAIELAAILSIAATKNKDKVGGVFFDHDVKKYIVPRKGLKHSLVFLRDSIAYKSTDNNTKDYEQIIDHVINTQKKKAIIFFISDFIDFDSYKKMGLLNKKHDLVCIKIKDRFEEYPPEFIYTDIKDYSETKSSCMSLSSSDLYSLDFKKNQKKFEEKLKKYGIDIINIYTEDDYIKKLQGFFKKRISRRNR